MPCRHYWVKITVVSRILLRAKLVPEKENRGQVILGRADNVLLKGQLSLVTVHLMERDVGFGLYSLKFILL